MYSSYQKSNKYCNYTKYKKELPKSKTKEWFLVERNDIVLN